MLEGYAAAVSLLTPPSGEVTFLFTDIEGSTSSWDGHHDAMAAAQVQHDAMVRGAIRRHGGYVFATGGDGVAVAFSSAIDAVAAAVEAQVAIEHHGWPPPLRIRVRMGLNTGTAVERDGDYFGPAVIKAARLMSMVDGGRICLSSTTAALVDGCVEGVELLPVGTVRMKGLGRPEAAWVVAAEGLAERGDPVGLDPLTPAPATLDKIVGRDTEAALLRRALAEHRLVTLIGIGGMGKTRLAQAIAAESERADGVAWVELAPATDTEAVIHQVARAVGATPRAGVELLTTVVASLTGRDVLVVLDNCEHVLVEAARLITALVERGATARFLATSRQRLGVAGEHVVPLGPLDTADPDAALQLLQRLLADTERDDPNLTQIVRLVDGIPLAIELAAARCRTLGVAQVATRLQHAVRRLADRQRQLERHRTLDGVIAWSYEAASDEARASLCQLAVFVGAFTIDSAEAMAADSTDSVGVVDVEDVIAELVDRSLLVRVGERFRMLEPIRQFALERLDDAALERAERRRVDAMRRRVDVAERELGGADEARWVAVLDGDWPDVRAAVRHALDTDDADAAAFFAIHLATEAFVRRPEAFAWIDEAARRYGGRPGPDQASLLGAASQVAWTNLDIERAVVLGERALACEAVPGTAHRILPQAGAIGAFNFSGQPGRAVEVARRALAESGDLPHLSRAMLLASLAMSCALAGEPDALDVARQAVQCGERSANPSALGLALYSYAMVASFAGRDTMEIALPIDRAITLASSVRNQWLVGMCRSMPQSFVAGGDPASAFVATLDVIDEQLRNGWPTHAWTFAWSLADQALAAEHAELAAMWLGQCSSSPVPRLLVDPLDPVLAALLDGTCTDGDLRRAFERGRTMPFSELRRLELVTT
jgi:predicted ATPase/class 3 adenylate cyclase